MANKNDGAMKLIKEIFKDGDKIKITGNNPLKDVIGTIIHNDGTKETKSFKSIPDFMCALLEELSNVSEEETGETPDVEDSKLSEGSENTESSNAMQTHQALSVNDILKNEYEAHQADLIYNKLDNIVSDIVAKLSDTSIKHEFCEGTDTVQSAVKLTINPEFDFSDNRDYIVYVCEEVKERCDFDYVSISTRSANGDITLYCVLK
jgi:hypothetical protein